MVTLAIDLYRSAATHPAVIRAGRWSLRLTTRLLARALNMPEPLLHSTGAFVVAHAQAAEARAAKTLCPFRLLRRFWARPRAAR
jgi:hypothetical protein